MYLFMVKQNKDYNKLLKEYEQTIIKRQLIHSDGIANLQGQMHELRHNIANDIKKG